MEAGGSSSSEKSQQWWKTRYQFLSLSPNFRHRLSTFQAIKKGKETSSSVQDFDRFIPWVDMDIAHVLLYQPMLPVVTPTREPYRRLLAETLLQNRTRIFSFQSNPPTPINSFLPESYTNRHNCLKLGNPPGRRIPQSAERILDAPEIADDYCLNLLDWGSRNILAIALGYSVYLWDATTASTSELVRVDEENGPVTSVIWAPDGRHIAVGLDNSNVQLWDSTNNHLLRVIKGVHNTPVGALSWNNNHHLTTGGMDGMIVNNDVRIKSPAVSAYHGHRLQVCGLKWADSGKQLASGGSDNLVHIWDLSMASSTPIPDQNQWLHRFNDHMGAVKGLAWCPFKSNLLASGGGEGDCCIKFWNTQTGACLNSTHTGSQVWSLQWNKNEKELLSSHGFNTNQLTLWEYPSMDKVAELTGHTSRVLFTAVSPDGCTVASAGGDEKLQLWNVFGDPEVAAKKQAYAKSAKTVAPFVGNIYTQIR